MTDSTSLIGKKAVLSIDSLVPDPLNTEAFDEENLTELQDNIHKEGFLGEISAYPIGNGQYMIESGHRRCQAARLAGYKEIPVNINAPPKDIEERRRRLVRWNLHNRPTTPLGMAKLAQFLYETYEMQNARCKREGLPTEPILDKVAADMECSKANVSKYRMLLSLSEGLQSLIQDGTCSWAPMSAASTLSINQQDSLYKRILGEIRLGGRVTGSWLEKEIREFRYVKDPDRTVRSYSYDRNNISCLTPELKSSLLSARKKGRRNRRCDGMKGIARCNEIIKVSLSEDALIHDCDQEKAAALLAEIQDRVSRALKKYKETGYLK